MKILFIAPTPFFSDRGTHIRILEEALALEKRGHQITIATYHIGRDVDGEVKTGIDVRRILRLLFWYKKTEAGPDWQKIILDLMLIRKVFYLARKQKPQIIHAHLHEGVLIGYLVQKMLFWRKIKLVADFHGSLVKEMESHGYLKKAFIKPIFGFMEKFINNLGDSAIASSWENSRIIASQRKDKSVEVVADGVNLNHYQLPFSQRELRQNLELPLDKKIIVYTGSLVPNKGIAFLFEALKIVSQKYPETFFLIAGFPAQPALDFVKTNKLEARVRIISPLNYFDLPKVLLSSDIAVDPKDTGVGQASGKILQYMGAGLPIVCFDKENNRRYLGEAAFLSGSISGQGLAEGIGYFLENPQVAEERGRQAAQRAFDFSWEKMAEKIEKIYGEVVSLEKSEKQPSSSL